MMDAKAWTEFIRESLKIEGIIRDPTAREMEATQHFVALPKLTVADVVALVSIYQPDAVLRDQPGLNVRVGRYIAPPGGPGIPAALRSLLDRISAEKIGAWTGHVAYEDLHPFTDGNGRSGRAIWLWAMGGEAPLGFLHHFYYQTLEQQRHRP